MCNVTSERKVRLTAMMREVMYEAAASVLAEHGVAGMTMERVAAAANTAKGSRYHCFADKQDLLQFTHTKTFEPLVAAAKGLHRNNLPVTARLEAILRLVFDHLDRHHELFSLSPKDSAALDVRGTAEQLSRGCVGANVAAIIQQGIEEDALEPIAPERAATMLLRATAAAERGDLARRSVNQAPDRCVSPWDHGPP